MPNAPSSTDPWSTGPPLDVLLREEPYRFTFFQAARILERLFPARPPVGADADPKEETVRFRAHLSLDFPASDIQRIEELGADRPWTMTVAFLGLTGPSGALPRFYTELLMERVRQKDRALRDFLDLFNHRLLSLFYRAWQKNRFWVSYERAEIVRRGYRDDPARLRAFTLETRPRVDLFSQSLLDLAGFGLPALRYRASDRRRLSPRTRVADTTLRYYAGLLALQPRSAIGLEGILEDYFGTRVQVVQFVGQWLLLDEENQSQLIEGGNTRLGSTAIAGQRFWDRQSRFRIRLGPLGWRHFQEYLPSGPAYQTLGDLVRLYAGPALDVDLQPVLKAEEVPECQLSEATEAGPRLGWNTWLRGAAFTRDADDAILTLAASF